MICDVAVWAFDVDGTVIGSIRSDRLRPGTSELLLALRERRVRCVLWSAGGDSYARRMAGAHGIEQHFEGFYAKKDRGPHGRFGVEHFRTFHRPTVFVDDSPGEVPAGIQVIGVPQFMGGNPADAVMVSLLERVDSLVGGDG